MKKKTKKKLLNKKIKIEFTRNSDDAVQLSERVAFIIN